MTQCQLLHSPRKMVKSLFLVFLIVCLTNVARSIKTEYIYSTHIDTCALYPKVQRCHSFCVQLLCRFDMNCLTFHILIHKNELLSKIPLIINLWNLPKSHRKLKWQTQTSKIVLAHNLIQCWYIRNNTKVKF
jgi:hypothetical protein